MNVWARAVLALATGFGLTVAAIEVMALDGDDGPPPGTRLGKLDFDEYCIRDVGPRAVAILVGDDAFGWRCWTRSASGLPTVYDVDVTVACEELYGAPAYAESWDLAVRYSWECFIGPRPADTTP